MTEEVCRSVADTVTEEECSQVEETRCDTVYRQQCSQVEDQQCETVTEEQCQVRSRCCQVISGDARFAPEC